MIRSRTSWLGLGVLLAWAAGLPAAGLEPLPEAPVLYSFRFRDAPLEVVLERMAEMSGRPVTADPGLQPTVTLATTDPLTAAEALVFLSRALAAQGLRMETLADGAVKIRAAGAGESLPEPTTAPPP
jgi:type II secretory pathway component GspD/PulD (secretin)